MVDLCERFGRYGMYSQEHVEPEIGRGPQPAPRRASELPARAAGCTAPASRSRRSRARTNYFREEYAYGQRGADRRHRAVPEPRRLRRGGAARARPAGDRARHRVRQPDGPGPGAGRAHRRARVPRRATARCIPQWLLVAMHHSGLFEDWRMPIATGVAWFHDCEGGEFAFYPDGADGAAGRATRSRTTPRSSSTPTACSTASTASRPPTTRWRRSSPGMQPRLRRRTARGSCATATRVVARYGWDELRFSVSWKAYCFADEDEQRSWREHADDLTLEPSSTASSTTCATAAASTATCPVTPIWRC